MSRHTFLGLYGVIAFMLAVSVSAVQPYQLNSAPSALGDLWRWHHISELDNEGFRCMAATSDGAVWFGVNEGLLRYDGTHWERHNSENGFVDNAVEQLAVSHDGTLYALSWNRLFRYADKQWKQIFPQHNNPVIAMSFLVPAKDGGVWLGSTRGLFHVKENAIKLITESRNVDGVQKQLPDHVVIEILPDLRKQGQGMMVGLFENDEGVLSIGYTTGWFVRIDTKSPFDALGACHSVKIPGNVSLRQIVSMFEMEDGLLWAGFGQNVYKMDISAGNYEAWPLSESRNGVQGHHALIRSKDGARFIASSSHVFGRSGERWNAFPYPSPDASNLPYMMVDAKQNLWVGKLHGRVYRIDLSNERWKTFEGLIFQDEDPLGVHWFLDAQGHVVCRREEGWIRYDPSDGLIDSPVALLCSRNGTVWVVGNHQRKAASAFLDSQGRWQLTIHNELPHHISPSSLFEDSNGGIWFGAYSGSARDAGGVICAKPDGAGSYRFEYNAKPMNWVRHITELPDKTLVIGGYDLWEINDSSPRRIINEQAKPIEKYLAMDNGQDGSLWVASEGFGVQRLRGGEWTHYTRQEGLAGNMVMALLCHDADEVWALSANGLSYFDGKGWTPHIYGFQFPGLFLLKGSMHKTKDGSLWINYATFSWFLRGEPRFEQVSDATFRSIRCRPASRPPETKITDYMERVALLGTTIRWLGTSPWQQTEDKELYYSWRLDDDAWSTYSLNRDVTLRSMKPGRHTFEVRARDYDLNVDPTPAAISFVVIAPVWQQAWFILLMVLFVGLILLAIWQWIRFHEERAVAAEKYAADMERMKLRFFTNISHELRTPLTVLLGTLKSALSNPKPALNESLSMALRNARKLQTLVNEMLDLRKIEQGEWKLEPKYGDIVLFVKEAAESLKPLAAEKNMTIRQSDCDAELVWFDPGKLNKIVTNLISNAIKYGSQDGSVTVHLNVQKDSGDEQDQPAEVVIRIEDDGMGIKAHELPHIFDRFYQGSSYRPAQSSSSGIGLAFTKELVTLWGGRIEVVSPVKEGRGTCFTVQLPLNIHPRDAAGNEVWPEPDDMEIGSPDSDGLEDHETGHDKERILIVDDDADLRRFIRNELGEHYAFFEAKDGAEGLKQAVEMIPDLILCDVMMPEVNGLELCMQLKQNELTQTIPIILLTGRTHETAELEGLLAGVDDFITKPFEIVKLNARIRNLLKSRRQLREHYSQEIAEVPSAESEPTMEDPFLQRAKEIVEEHLADFEFDTKVLAEKMAVSNSSLLRKLKLTAEKTPAAFIRELRLRQAYLMLQQKDILIEEVAEQVGFLDTNYFRRCFKQQFSITPGQCREGEGLLPETQPEERGPETGVEIFSRTVLVVEDDTDLRHYLCNELKARNYVILEAENGKDGLEQAKASIPDLIVTDLMMPIMNGMELCAAIRQNDTTNHIPMVMLTARTDEKIEIEGLDVGVDEYITKPFEMEVLTAHLNNLLALRRKMAVRYRQQIADASGNDSLSGIEDPFVQRVTACIEENLPDASFSVELLAEKVGCNVRTLQRKISAVTDFTPNALIKTMRLKKAYKLLKTTQMSIGDVACNCGFAKTKYFSIQFKQQYGCSPSQVRKK